MAAKTEKPIFDVAPAAIAALIEYDFPGNVRELENIIERAFVHCRGPRLELEHFPEEVLRGSSAPATPAPEPDEAAVAPPSLSVEAAAAPPSGSVEGAALLAALQAHRWNRTDTALALRIGRNTLWRRMKRFGLIG
jgi:transcriptional regulator of acetoin/glycerol metabolism